MKKTLALLLALALTLTLCACGEAKQTETPAATEAPGAAISKPGGETKTAEAATVKPKETAEPTPEPTPEPAEIEITDLCAISGKLAEAGIYSSTFSFTLPAVSGPDTAYIRALNETVQGIYEGYVKDALDSYEAYGTLPRYCVSYYVGELDGVHSILITSDSDYGVDDYWCFNFDDAGNEVDNQTVLKAAGLTEKKFLSAAHDYLEAFTDLSEYFEDDEDNGWKQLQEDTLDEKNLNADVPMVILPDDNLGFVVTIYTMAGAGEYDHVLEFYDDGSVDSADVGDILVDLLSYTFLRMGDNDDPDATEQVMYEFFKIGDTLTMEATSFDAEYGGVMSYWAVDIIPDDPADLLRTDGGPVRVRVLSHCPDVFGGSYYGEPGYYTLYAFPGGIAFTDFEGGTSLDGTDGDVYLVRAYRDEYDLDDPTPGVDYDNFDYDAAEEAGLAGIWSGTYRDEDSNVHSLTLEITIWGDLKLRDCVDGQIPRILAGSYYIAQEGNDFDAPEGTVVFDLVRVGGYKMPVMGYCYMWIDSDSGELLIAEDDESFLSPLTLCGENYLAYLRRVPDVRYCVEPTVYALDEDERVHVDINNDGTPEELGCYFERDSYDTITAAVFVVEGKETRLNDMYIYGADIYLMVPPMSGEVYFYIDGQSDNDYHVITIVGISQDDIWFVEDCLAGFGAAPTSPEDLQIRVRQQLMSTTEGVRAYRVGMNGLPEPIEPFFRIDSDLTLTAKQDVDGWLVASDTGEPVDFTTLSAGTKVKLMRTDGSSFMDLQLKNGDVCRVWLEGETWEKTIGGVDIRDLFDGIRFAG